MIPYSGLLFFYLLALLLLPAAVMVLVAGLILLGVGAAIIDTMPPGGTAWEM